ncbi:MAG TPA: hypothetical protein VMR74_17065, partial [Gammaproteobacteria bacterium]|nr:hypothetical protein [Gammaproteobacteria bacterium]
MPGQSIGRWIGRFVPTVALALLATLAGAAALERGVPEALGVSSERLDRLSQALSGYVENEQLAGSVTLVARHGE